MIAATRVPRPTRQHHRPTATTGRRTGRHIVCLDCCRLGLLPALLLVLAGVAPAAETSVVVTLSTGGSLTGQLVSLDSKQLQLDAAGNDQAESASPERQAIDIGGVRRIVMKPQAASEGQAVVGLSDGSRIAGDVTSITAAEARLVVAGAGLTLATERLHWIAWPDPQSLTPAADWLADLPTPAGGDLVVIRRDQGWQFIECAISEITAEEVVVLLEGETIPVKRTKLAGLCWLRSETKPGATPEPAVNDILLGLPGGSLRCRRISRPASQADWTIELGTLAGKAATVSLPAIAVHSIDYAFGRQIDLTSRPPLSTSVEPYFTDLADDDTLRSYFHPRVVTQPVSDRDQADSVPGLLVRPRTEIIWGLPPDSRRLQMRLLPANTAAISPAVIRIDVDGEERLQATIGRATTTDGHPGLPVNLDIHGGRKLRLLVDFAKPASADAVSTAVPLLGGPVLIQAPTIER